MTDRPNAMDGSIGQLPIQITPADRVSGTAGEGTYAKTLDTFLETGVWPAR